MRMHSVFIKQVERLRRLVVGMGLRAEEGEDILQDVYLEAIRRPPKHCGAEKAGRWLIQVTINRCLLEFRKSLLEFRKRGRYQRATNEVLKQQTELKHAPLGPDKKVIRAEEIEAMRQCLSEMNESLQVPLVMKYFCELNSNEIGEILELKPGTVRKRLCKGRIILAETLLRSKGIKP
ncbi:MAG: sigma-70 family RNA polymerase sigma factor [Planctomycetes bacterium]|nr:sigma-70 family RNA polymerase sigma factor [Planctomycetota bacterium]